MSWNNDDDGRPNPWGRPQGNQDGNKPRRPQDINDLGLEEILRKAKQNFGNYGGGSGANISMPNPKKYIMFGLLAALVLWLLSGIYFIQPNQHGVVLTFGKYTRTDELPGPKWRAPWPIQSVKVVDVMMERRIQIGFSSQDKGFTQSQNGNVHNESLMLTGDENIVDINFVVLWRVANAKDYLYSIRDPEDTIAMVAASTMREIIGQNKIQPILTDARTKIQSDARVLMQKLLDEYNSGVTINNVQLQKVDPPAAVVDAFNEVQRARQTKETLKNQAETYRNEIIPVAKGQAEKMRQEAEAYKQQIVKRAEGDASRFNSILAAYRNAPEVTSDRMYLETMEEILQNTKTVILGSNGAGNVLPYLPLNELKKQAPKETQ
jgi:membrane protease subunit HflK